MRFFKRKRKYALIIFILSFILLPLLVFLFIDRNINPAIISMSEAELRYIATKAMNNTVEEHMGNNIKYTDLINVLTDKDGKITMLQANTVKMNALATHISTLAQERIRTDGMKGINIPLGSVTGSKILAGWGPRINVKIIPISDISTQFISEFENSGINQTRHKISLRMVARVRIVIPLDSSDMDVVTSIPITETIIVGDVPQQYINVDDTDRMLNLVPDPN